MLKQVPKSERIQALVAKAYGDPEVSLDNLAVFEAVIANTTPLRRKSGLFAGAVLGVDTLAQLSDKINSGDHVPLQLMHRSGIPVGKVFHAEMKPTKSGGTQLNALFYLPKQDSQYVNKIDTGVINDVSVGFQPKQLMCSSCGFDFMGDKATFANIYDCVCDQGHTIGKDGVYGRVHGVNQFSELSLVDQGAVPGAMILPRSQQSIGTNPNMARFASEGLDERAFFLFASNADFNQSEQELPDMKELIEVSAKLMVAERDVTDLKAKVTAFDTDLAAKLAVKDTAIADLTAKLAAAEATATAATALDAVKLKTDLDLAMGLINEFGTATLAVLGKTEALPEVTSERIAFVRKARADLALSLVAGGVSSPAARGEQQADANAPNFSSFKRS